MAILIAACSRTCCQIYKIGSIYHVHYKMMSTVDQVVPIYRIGISHSWGFEDVSALFPSGTCLCTCIVGTKCRKFDICKWVYVCVLVSDKWGWSQFAISAGADVCQREGDHDAAGRKPVSCLKCRFQREVVWWSSSYQLMFSIMPMCSSSQLKDWLFTYIPVVWHELWSESWEACIFWTMHENRIVSIVREVESLDTDSSSNSPWVLGPARNNLIFALVSWFSCTQALSILSA